MDLSGIIFVALAVAWAVYLIPKALKHHDEVVRSRSVDRFSHTMRVLARRVPVNTRDARLVVTPARAAAPVVETKPAHPTPVQVRSRRDAERRATRRRRRVLGLLLLANAAVAGAAGYGLITWWWQAVPGGLVVLWLIACRVMVRRERAVPRSAFGPADTAPAVPADPREDRDVDDTTSIPAIASPVADPSLWDPLPVTLPTYVSKPAATRRSVRTIDLDDSGVWTSGRTEADAALAREADAQRAADGSSEGDQRAVGS